MKQSTVISHVLYFVNWNNLFKLIQSQIRFQEALQNFGQDTSGDSVQVGLVHKKVN